MTKNIKKRISFLITIGIVWTAVVYPQTAVRPPGGGTSGNPFYVSTLEHLHFISLNPGGGVFIQVADIDASASRHWDGGKGFSPVGNLEDPFRGFYDGKGYVIKGLYINRPSTDDVGFIGNIFGGEIINVGLVDAHIIGKNQVGGVAGQMNYSNPLTGCFVTGSVTGEGNVGGLVGETNELSVNYCYTSCTVTGSSYGAGGLIGTNVHCPVLNCYATGNVSGSHFVGGLIGWAMSSSGYPAIALLSGCYYSGKVIVADATQGGGLVGYNTSFSIVTNCYWNSQISGNVSGCGLNSGTFIGTGLTTAQMTHPGSFAGWNFSGAWKIRDGHTYPALNDVSDNAPFAFAEELSEHTNHFAVSSLLLNDYDYETLQGSLLLKIKSLSAGHYDAQNIYFPASARMGDTLTVTYQLGEARAAKNDTLWGNIATSRLIYFNRAPEILTVASKVTDEEMPVSIVMEDITATDPDNDPVSLVIFNGNHYSVSGNTVTPAPNYNGPLSVGIAASDGSFKSDTAYMYIMVTPVNDAPVLTAGHEITMDEDISLPLSLDVVSASDADGDPLTLLLGDGDNYSLEGSTIIPLPDYYGILTVPLSVSDGTDTSVVMNLKITVTPVNDPPVILSTASTTVLKEEEYIYTAVVSDVDDTAFTYSLSWKPVGMTISDDGIIRWIAAKGITSSGEVQLSVTDGLLEDTETFTIRVSNVNNAPVARDTSVTTDGNTPVIILAGAHDSDGTITAIAIDEDPHHGIVRRSGLSVTYTPDPGFAGIDSLSWHAVDNDGLVSNTAKIYFTITTITGLDRLNNGDILFYPNPCTDGFYVNAGQGSEVLTMYDLNGKFILAQSVKGLTRVNLPDLPDGTYIVIVNGQNYKLITKR